MLTFHLLPPRGKVSVAACSTFWHEMDSTSTSKAEVPDEKPSGGAIEEPPQLEEAAAPPRDNKSEPEVKAKTGRAKRKEKRLRHEPQNVTGER